MKTIPKRSTIILLSAVLLLFCLCASAISAELISVQAEGAAAIVNGDKDKARSEAKNQAYRDALEKGVGAMVQGITEI